MKEQKKKQTEEAEFRNPPNTKEKEVKNETKNSKNWNAEKEELTNKAEEGKEYKKAEEAEKTQEKIKVGNL